MIKFKTKIEGLEEVIRRIEDYSKTMGDDIDEELSVGAQNIAQRARQDAPIGRTGALGNYIRASVTERYNKQVEAFAPYSAYVEFGTGSRVFEAKSGFMFTPEMKEFAHEFYVNGKGRQPAQPFLFPAFEVEKLEIIRRIRAILLKSIRV